MSLLQSHFISEYPMNKQVPLNKWRESEYKSDFLKWFLMQSGTYLNLYILFQNSKLNTMALEEFLDGKDIKRNILEVKVIKSTSADKFIIGDASSLALLDLTKNPTHSKGSI